MNVIPTDDKFLNTSIRGGHTIRLSTLLIKLLTQSYALLIICIICISNHVLTLMVRRTPNEVKLEIVSLKGMAFFYYYYLKKII